MYGQARQVAQRRIPGAEVIDAYPHAQIANFPELLDVACRVVQDEGFRDFDIDTGLAASELDHVPERPDEVASLELHGRDVHGHPWRVRALLQPSGPLQARLVQYPGPDLHNHPGLLQDRNELCRADQSQLRIPPADEGFDAAQMACLGIDFRLVVQREFLALQRSPQLVLES